ncbi:MAG TPA: tetratricopeptide repeat protein, partial [Anaerolineae bacterium]
QTKGENPTRCHPPPRAGQVHHSVEARIARLSLSFLGPWQVIFDGEAVTSFKYDKVRALLAYLATEADRPHRRETLMGMLWPELPEAAARNNLRQVLVTLREAIGDRTAEPPYLLTSRATVQFNPDSDAWLDVTAFTDLLAACERHPHRSPDNCKTCAERLQQVAELYRGPFLAEFFLPDSVAFEEWTLLKREWLQRQMLAALARLTAYHERRGQYEQASRYARRQLELEPWHEEAHRQLMRLHFLRGERNAALAQYEQCRRVLVEELGVEPEAETTALYEQIRDATEDVPIALERLALPAERPHTLPPQPTPFVGRETELQEIGRLLDTMDCRLLTLTGPGGVGKTRLALQAAAEHLDTFADGVFFVSLASLPSADLLIRAIANALRLEVEAAADPRTQLLAQLRHKEMLLVLDNFEHLLEGVDLLADILRGAAGVTLLVTSRERLDLQREWVFTVEGLSTPCPTQPSTLEVENNDAVQLFVQSARRVRTDFALSPENQTDIVRICQLVAGLPLALELAAAWVRVLSCREIADEIEQGIGFLTTTLRDVPERHRSLTAVFDHSWRLLSAEEQAVLPKLSVFEGGFRRQAAGRVAGASLPTLAALVDKSLLQWNPSGRYAMHEMVCQYAEGKLQASEETAVVQARHLEYYLDWAITADPNLVGAEAAGWLEQFEAEKDNLRTALTRVLRHGEAESGLQLVGALWWFWYTRGYHSEGRTWLAKALARDETGEPGDARAKALQGAGVLAWNQGDYAAARSYYEEALAIRRASGDQLAISALLNNLGNLAMDQGDYVTARQSHEESLAIKRVLDDQRGIAISLGNLGIVAYQQGDYDTARSFYEESLVIKRALDDRRGISLTVGNLGNVLFEQGNYPAARALLEESLALKRELGDKWGIATTLGNLGEVALGEGDLAAARKRLGESLEIRRELGDKWSIADSLEAFAALAFAEGDLEQAALLWGTAEALREAIGTSQAAGDRARHDRNVAAARAQLGEEAIATAWAEGRAMSPEQAADYALGLFNYAQS